MYNYVHLFDKQVCKSVAKCLGAFYRHLGMQIGAGVTIMLPDHSPTTMAIQSRGNDTDQLQ